MSSPSHSAHCLSAAAGFFIFAVSLSLIILAGGDRRADVHSIQAGHTAITKCPDRIAPPRAFTISSPMISLHIQCLPGPLRQSPFAAVCYGSV